MVVSNGTTLKKQQVANHLRQRIVAGELAPGDRLPTRLQLEEQFGVSTITIQQALDSLVASEFVRVNGRRGTYVAPEPPHLTRYALVLRLHPTRDPRHWTRFHTALCDEAARLQRQGDKRIFAFTGVEPHADSLDFLSLVAQVREQRLAGMIFTSPLFYEDTPLLEEPGLGRVWVEADAFAIPGVETVALNRNSFWLRALDYFAQAGRTKLAVLHSAVGDFGWLFEQAASRGIKMQEHWMQAVDIFGADAARNNVHLLFHRSYAERPDALLITDDNLLEAATQGLLDAGVRAPDEVEVVTHCNFPYPAPSLVPVKRLGFDIRAVLNLSLEKIDRQRRGEAGEPLSQVMARFEDEL